MDLENHQTLTHNRECEECNEHFRTLDKLHEHTCKKEISNPSFQTYYSRSWMDANGCNKIYCDITKQEVVILHSEKCIKGDKFCCWFPYQLHGQNSEVIHLEFELYTKGFIFRRNREMKWAELVIALN